MRDTELFTEGNRERLEAFGVKLTQRGAHSSRTLMLQEIAALLHATPKDATAEIYRNAVVSQNVLNKTTTATRIESFERLSVLYGLSVCPPLLSVYRELAELDPASLPLLSFLLAWGRDSQLRGTTDAVLAASPGTPFNSVMLEKSLKDYAQDQYGEGTISRIASNAISSWTQAGYLIGRVKKTRSAIKPSPTVAALALLISDIAGFHGGQAFTSPWCRLLELSPAAARALASQAHGIGILSFKSSGTVVELSFPKFIQPLSNNI